MAGRQRVRCELRHLGEEVGGDGEGGCGSGGWGVEEVDLAGLLLEGEIHEQGAVEVDRLGADAAAAFAGDVRHADFGDEALEVFEKDFFAEGISQLAPSGAGIFSEKPVEAGKSEGLPRIAQGDIRAPVALALKGEHGIWPRFDATTDHAGEVHAEEWERGIGNGINQVPDEVRAGGCQFPIIAAKGDDARLGTQAGRSGDAVAMQAGAVDDEVGLDVTLRGADDLPSAAGANAEGGGACANLVAGGEDQFRHLAHHSRVVDDALLRHTQSGEASRVGFDLPNGSALEPLQAAQSIGRSTRFELAQSHDFGRVDREHDLSTDIMRNPILATKCHHLPNTLHSELRLERAGFVVESAMQNAGVVTALVAAGGGILLQ